MSCPDYIVAQCDAGTHRYNWLGHTVTVDIVTVGIDLLAILNSLGLTEGVVTFEVCPPQSQICSVGDECSVLHSLNYSSTDTGHRHSPAYCDRNVNHCFIHFCTFRD